MPYLFPWDETAPPGSAPANTLDTIIQDLKKSIRERMNDVLVVDWTADPLVLQPEFVGGVNGLKHFIPWTSFKAVNQPAGGGGTDLDGTLAGLISYIDNNPTWAAPIRIPVNCVIKNIALAAKIPAGSTGLFRIQSVALASATATWADLDTLACVPNANGFFNVYTKVVNITVQDAFHQILLSGFDTGHQFLGAVLTYDRPSFLVGA